MNRLFAGLLALSLSGSAFGAELPSYFKGARPLGMGNAFTAVSDDENALFYNPAGLDRVRSWGMGVINPLFEVGEAGADALKDAWDTDLDNTDAVVELLRKYNGEYAHYRAALLPYFLTRHLGLGVLVQGTASTEPRNLIAFPEAMVDSFASIGAHAGFGYGFWDGILRLGVGGKFIKAYRLEETYDAAQIADDNFSDQVEDDMKDGSGFGFDAGAMVTIPVLLEPTFGATILNIADTDLGDAGELPQQVNLGVSVSHPFSWITMVAAADWVDVTESVGEDDDIYKRLHFGLEGRMAKILSLRAGLNQGYGTMGATLDFRALKLDYATYAEEIGSSAGDRSDRRHVLQVSLGW